MFYITLSIHYYMNITMKCQKLQMTAQPGLAPHRMLYSCTHVATVGVKWLTHAWVTVSWQNYDIRLL